jgi:putative phosphotransacetylase
MRIKIGVSARHVHLNKDDFELLFGEGKQLTKLKNLYRPGEFAANETLTIKTDKAKIENVRVVGPIREYTQIEISKSDAHVLGLNPPIRNSSDILGSEPITLITEKGEVYKPYGCIIATRHVHITSRDIEKYDWDHNKRVRVKLFGEKGGIIENVHVRIENDTNFEMHIDLDDANAFLIKHGDEGEILPDE